MFGFFKKYDAHLCSAVTGRILNNVKPLVGVKIERELIDFDSKTHEDSTLSDEHGYFSLPAINIRSRSAGALFRELLTNQDIYIQRKGVSFTLWSTTLWGVEPVTAFNKKLAQLEADVSNNEVAFTFINENNPNVPYCARSICRWESDFTILRIIED